MGERNISNMTDCFGFYFCSNYGERNRLTGEVDGLVGTGRDRLRNSLQNIEFNNSEGITKMLWSDP